MAALTAARNTKRRENRVRAYPVKGATRVFQGSIACLNASGLLVPGATSTTLTPVGMALVTTDNLTGADGAVKAEVEPGTYRYANSTSTEAIALTEVGKDCYLVDDQTVAKTNGGSTRSVAGKVIDVDAQGVWVRVGTF